MSFIPTSPAPDIAAQQEFTGIFSDEFQVAMAARCHKAPTFVPSHTLADSRDLLLISVSVITGTNGIRAGYESSPHCTASRIPVVSSSRESPSTSEYESKTTWYAKT